MTDVIVKTYGPVSDPRLGRIVEHDERSKQYRIAYPATVQPVSVKHKRYIPILDQGQLGSCTGNAAVGCIGTGEFYATVTGLLQAKALLPNEDMAVKVYSRATQLDNITGEYPPTDTGSSGLAVAKALVELGLISGYTHAFGFGDLLAALQKQPVIVGVNWYRGMFYPDKNGVIRVGANDQLDGGHEFVLDEIDADHELIGATNSWGDKWGVGGRFFIPFDLMQRLLNEQGDVTVFSPITAPAPQPTPVPTPAPAPTPTPAPSADETLWADAKDWAGGRHYGKTKGIANALTTWAKAKGLTA